MTPEGVKTSGLLREAEKQLLATGNQLARRDAEIMLANLLDINPSRLPLIDKIPPTGILQKFAEWIDRRSMGEPVAYITGVQEFWSLEFAVDENTLIPRPDTETLVEACLAHVKHVNAPKIADLGTGSGCILISLLSELLSATGLGLEVSEGALKLAQQNAFTNDVQDRSRFLKSDWFASVPADETFDLIVSNPPYIETNVIPGLMLDVKEYEPVSALDGGDDGLDCYRAIATQACGRLNRNGILAVEVGIEQAQAVALLFRDAGLTFVAIERDLAGVERVVCVKKQ